MSLAKWFHQSVIRQRRASCVICDKDIGWKDISDAVGCYGYFLCSEQCYLVLASTWEEDSYHTDWRLRNIHKQLTER